MAQWLAILFAGAAVAGCALASVFIAGQLYLIGLHLYLRRSGLADEAKRLSYPLPADTELPHIAVQIPVFNEGKIVERAIASAAKLDWPKDKLHIQICDDSDDETTELARAAILLQTKNGIDIALLRRPDRSDFKAGNLREAMKKTSHQYFAIFDVDYVPPPNFLRRCMAVILSDPNFAFVQARPDFLNAEENALTRAQALSLDGHYAIEQATRSWTNDPFPFNGTCGIWRRTAIEAGGGWVGSTLAEDMDLSYRVWLKGWRSIFLISVSSPGELPANFKAWALQQKRWMTGSGQVAFTMFPVVWHHQRLSTSKCVRTLFYLVMGWLGSALDLALLTGAVAVVLRPTLIIVLGPMLAALLLSTFASLFIGQRIGNRLIRRDATSLSQFIREFVYVLLFEAYMTPFNFLSLWNALTSRKIIFERTTKKGSAKQTH